MSLLIDADAKFLETQTDVFVPRADTLGRDVEQDADAPTRESAFQGEVLPILVVLHPPSCPTPFFTRQEHEQWETYFTSLSISCVILATKPSHTLPTLQRTISGYERADHFVSSKEADAQFPDPACASSFEEGRTTQTQDPVYCEGSVVRRRKNGDVVYLHHVVVDVKTTLFSKPVWLCVTITPPDRMPGQEEGAGTVALLKQLVSESRVTRVDQPTREFHLPLTVFHPLEVRTNTVSLPPRSIFSIEATNHHTTLPVTIFDANLHLHVHKGDTRPMESLHRRHSVKMDKSQFPVKLGVAEQHCFVVTLEPLSRTFADQRNLLPGTYSASLTLRWCIAGQDRAALSQYDVEWRVEEQTEVMLSMECTSPVRVNTVFDVQLTVTNFSKTSREFTLVMPPLNSEAEEDPLPPNMFGGSGSMAASFPLVPSSSLLFRKEGERTANARSLRALKTEGTQRNQPVLSLEKSLFLGPLEPEGSRTVTIPFLALHPGLAEIRDIQVVEMQENKRYQSRSSFQVLVVGG